MARILYVDHDEQLSRVIHDYWAASGHECATVSRGALACEALFELGGDLVIVEVMMPDVCGFEVVRRIRADRRLFPTPVMLVSHMAAEEEIRHGLAQGADDYVCKPLNFENFCARATSLLAISASIAQSDPLTHLMNKRMAKYVMEHHVGAQRPFAVMCLELMHLTEFWRRAGVEAAKTALLHAAGILEDCGKPLNDRFFRPAHMGGGHFMCVIQPENAEKYCGSVLGAWREQLPAFYSSVGFASRTAESARDVPGLCALVYYTFCTGHPMRSAHDCFQTLIAMREHARWSGEGIYADRRVG